MTEYDFALVVSCQEAATENSICTIADSLYEAGARDATVSAKRNLLIVDFDREADSYELAVISAIKDVNSINGLIVKSVDAGQFVGLSDAAELSDLTRSALSKFNKGERGDGTFPTPYLRVNGKNPLFDWEEIATWLEKRGLLDKGIAHNARVTANINIALKLKDGDLEALSRIVAAI